MVDVIFSTIWTITRNSPTDGKEANLVDRQVGNVIYKDSQGLATAHSGAPGDTAAICLSFVSSYKTQSALHVICQRAAHSDRYRVQEDPRHTASKGERWMEGELQGKGRGHETERKAVETRSCGVCEPPKLVKKVCLGVH